MYSETAIQCAERRLKEELRALVLKRAEAEARYAERRQNRKVLENMVSRRRAQEQIESSRREQSQIDEATLQRIRVEAVPSNFGKRE